jgi:nucleoside permease NupC
MPKLRVLEKQEEQQPQKKENMSENQETQTVEEKPDKNMLQIVYEYVMSAINTIVPVLKWLYFISKMYIIWITIHYISCQLYVHYCVPSGITGYLLSPFLVSSPQCKALRWAFYNGGNIIDNMWNYLGVWASTQLLKIE